MITFSEVQASLSLFAEAIAGRPVAFEVSEDAQACWPERWSTSAGFVRTPQVRVPGQLGSRRTYRSLVLHELLVNERQQPAELLESRDAVLHELFAIVEDHRVVAFTRWCFPGAVASLDASLERGARGAGPASGNAEDPLLHALRCRTLGVGADLVVRWLPDLDERVLVEAWRLLDMVMAPDASALDSLQIARRLHDLHAAATLGSAAFEELIGEAVPDEDEPALPSEATSGVSVDGGTPTEFVESDGLAGGELLSEDDDGATAATSAEEEAAQPGIRLPAMPGASTAALERRTFVYDEWDYHSAQYRRAWCRVIEERLVGDDPGFISDVRQRHQWLRARIRSSLMRLRPQDLVRVYRSDDGAELDLDAAIEAVVDRRSGAPVDDRLHVRRDRAARDVATAFLVDLSASTSSPAVPPEPATEPLPEIDPMDDPMSYGPVWQTPPESEPIRRVIDVAKDAVALMGDALHELGDRYAIYGFSGTGRENVEFKIGKDFDDRVSAVTWANIGAMKPLRYTRMGPAVRHATAKLASQSARTRLLIVISDGYPQDSDYGRDRHDRDYGVHDTGRALADAADLGIETFCVTIDPAGHDYLRTMCEADRYAVIDDVESLPEELAAIYLNQMGSSFGR